MRIEGSSISCGVRLLVIDKNERPSKEEVAKLVSANRGSCAIMMTGVPAKHKNVIKALLDNHFERIKKTEYIANSSIKDDFADIAFLVMYHGHEYDFDDVEDDVARFDKFVGSTISDDLIDFASLVIHHGDVPPGAIKFFIRYMDK
jgi:hypothetical protein